MRYVPKNIGEMFEFPINLLGGNVFFEETLKTNRSVSHLITLIGKSGAKKEEESHRIYRGKRMATFLLCEEDVILSARKNAIELQIFGFVVKEINVKKKSCKAQAIFGMIDGHFENGKELQHYLFQPVLELISRIQSFQHY